MLGKFSACVSSLMGQTQKLVSAASRFLFKLPHGAPFLSPLLPALALAMGRDNVSGGVANLVVITEAGVERVVVPGDKLPTFHDE